MGDLKNKTSGEKYWILAVRTLAFIIGFLPFLPNALFYLGLKENELPISTSMVFFVVVGFVMLWGSANFGVWANAIGKKITNKTMTLFVTILSFTIMVLVLVSDHLNKLFPDDQDTPAKKNN